MSKILDVLPFGNTQLPQTVEPGFKVIIDGKNMALSFHGFKYK